MALSVEDLMKPRYKIIADYPKSLFEIGNILAQDMETVGEVFVLESELGQRIDKNWVDKNEITKYPHLFQPLQWWEERKEDEMPEYVKSIYTEFVDKVLKYDYERGSVYLESHNAISSDLKIFLPATPEEYEAYITQKQKA